MDVKLYIEAYKNEDANGTGLPVDIREVDSHKHKGLLQFTYISTSFVAIRKQVLTTLTEHNYKLKQMNISRRSSRPRSRNSDGVSIPSYSGVVCNIKKGPLRAFPSMIRVID